MPNSPNKKEIIDIRILRLIGLEDVFDLDYETYLTLLKEAMVRGRMSRSTIPTEEIMLLTEEYKRVKGKKGNGRFKVQPKRLTSSIGGSIKSVASKIQKTNIKTFLPGSKVDLKQTSTGFEGTLSSIQQTLDSIYNLLVTQQKNLKDAAEKQRRKEEAERRKASEERLEKGFKAVAKVANKVVAPVKSILSRIIDFFVAIFIGRTIVKLLQWFADPKNKRKVDAIFRFLGDHWPKLLGMYILFGTKFGKFVRGISKFLIRGIVAFAAKNPKIAAVVGVTAASAAIIAQLTKSLQGKDKGSEKEEQSPTLLGFYGGGLAPSINLFNFFGGSSGLVTGQKGIDKIPAMLTEGEFVMSRGAVQKYGLDTLMAMNASGGGTNVPRMIGGIPHARGGGFFGRAKPTPPANNIVPTGIFRPSAGMVDPITGMTPTDFAQNAARNPYRSAPQPSLFGRRGLSTRGVQAGFTGMGKEGFEAIMRGDKFRLGNWKPQILGRGAYSAPTLRGAQRYAGASGSLGGRQLPGGVIRTIVPGGARRINFLEPQAAVKPSTFDKGKALADKLMRGAYANSPLANRLRSQLMSGAAMNVGLGLGKTLGRGLQILNAPVIGDMLDPAGTSAYDQLTGPNAYYNAPGYRGPKPMRFSGGPAPNTSRRSYSIAPPTPRTSKVMYVNTPSGGKSSGSSIPAGQSIPSFSAVTSDSRRYAKAAQLGIG
jgi:hypothetical protein